MLQIAPNHADHITSYNEKFLSKLFKDDMLVQLKYDGERMLIHIDNGNIYCTSRRISKKTGKFMELQDKLPKVNKLFGNIDLGYTVIDCECYAKNWSEAASILHSLPDRAIALQNDGINIKFAVFDCLFYNGNDIRNEPYKFRLDMAKDICNKVNAFETVHIVGNLEPINNYTDAFIRMNEAIQLGFEGVVVKSENLAYYDKAASLKCKKTETVDVVVYDYIKGNGKYSNTIGALKVGYYDKETDSIKHISKVNCGTDDERNMWFDNWNKLQFSVIEVKCQEITDSSLRHPVYVRLRNDKDYTMCTYDTIFK